MPPRIRQPRLSFSTSIATPSQSSQKYQCVNQSRTFSQSTQLEQTVQRRKMFEWLNGPGSAFKDPLPGSTNYLSAYDSLGNLIRGSQDPEKLKGRDGEEGTAQADALGLSDKEIPREQKGDMHPFPLNRAFRSQSVLSEELRQAVFDRVKKEGKSVRVVSVELGIDMRRVAAVVRLGELEQRMQNQGKPMAIPYAKAVLKMLPTTPYDPQRPVQHESINDLPIHSLTDPQIFHPINEGEEFTRTDAGRVFSAAPALLNRANKHPPLKPTGEKVGKGDKEELVLLPPDARIPHPHLIAYERALLDQGADPEKIHDEYIQRLTKEEAEAAKGRQRRREQEATKTVKVAPQASRWEFRFKDVTVSKETTGADGRGRSGVGMRYGVPHGDRRRGTVKIPTKVEV